jgi:tRNA-dihydrouridine synthase B
MQKIGKLKISKGAFLAPMADYTNVAFRTLCKEYGSALQYTELISAKALLHKSKKTEKMLFVSEKEKPVFLQLFGNTPKDFHDAITLVEKKFPENFAGYDLNCGCSVPKAIKGKYGCYLMDYPLLVGEIISAMKSATKKPVTIKMRLGLSKETFLEVAREAEKNGVDAIALHSRMGNSGYSGKAKWDKIKVLKEKVNVPIIANGDIFSVEDYLKIKKETNCDFVMIGRGAIGDAFLFKQILSSENKMKVLLRSEKELLSEGKRYLELAQKFKLKVNDVRPYFIGLANGFRGAKKMRNEIALSKSIPEIEKHFVEFFK